MQHNDAVEIARNFTGTRNSDWTPIFQTFEVHGIEFEMCLVPPGSFTMGSDDENADDSEKPAHTQTITEPYWIGVHPVTNAQWRIAVENSKGAVKVPEWADWYDDNSKSNHPVVGVTWYQCVEFLKWLGTEWRLPTETRWEYTARGLDNLIYPFGNNFKSRLVVYRENSNRSTVAVSGRPKGASWVGAQDMSGNVWEWTASSFTGHYWHILDTRYGIIDSDSRMLRGGSCYDSAYDLRAVARMNYRATTELSNLSFRVLYSLSNT